MRFISKYKEYRIVIKPAYHQFNEGAAVYVSGKSVQFHDGLFETEDAETIEALKKAAGFGLEFWSDSPEAEVNPIAENKAREGAIASSPNACTYCGFVAANEQGLRFHMRKHDNKSNE